MRTKSSLVNLVESILILVFLTIMPDLNAQKETYRMTTDIPASVTTPDVVETSLGSLRFFDGFPDEATVEKLYDNLDLQRAVQAYLLGLPAVNMVAIRNALTEWGPPNITIPTWETLIDSRTLWLTANCNTPYTSMWINLRNGPLVLEVPPGVLGMINDLWSRYVVDIGMIGPDKGEGGKYLVLPPGYDGAIPQGYFVVKSSTYECVYFFRSFAVNGDFKPAIENIKKYARVYQLSQADNPPANHFVDISGKSFSGIAPADYSFWEFLDEAVQGEPVESYDRISMGYFASIGIEKGKTFSPDARMKKILSEAATVGDATARAIAYRMRQKENYYYDNSSWRSLFLGGYKFENQEGILNLDAFTYFHFFLVGISPAEDIMLVGKGSQYLVAFTDADGNLLDGSKNYKLHYPPDVPVNDFWSVILYDYQTRSMLQTNQQFPMVSSQNSGLIVNPDRSADIYFGPDAPPGKESNWAQTVPGKGWFTMLRFYGPLKPFFDKTWRPGEIELVK